MNHYWLKTVTFLKENDAREKKNFLKLTEQGEMTFKKQKKLKQQNTFDKRLSVELEKNCNEFDEPDTNITDTQEVSAKALFANFQ